MTGGRVEQKLVRPVVDKSLDLATRVDDQYLGSHVQEFVEESKTEYELARARRSGGGGGHGPGAGGGPKSGSDGPTSRGPPVYHGNDRGHA